MATKKNYSVNGHEYYRLRKKVGEKNGKAVYKAFYGVGKKDAEDQYDKWLKQNASKERQTKMSLDLTSFSDRADEFIESALKPSEKYAQGSKTRYISSYRTHVRSSFLADMSASHVKAKDIQKFYNEIDVSRQTLKQIHKFMSAFYKWMSRNEYAPNVLDAVEIPIKKDTKKHEEIVTWSEDEIKTITDNLGDHRLRFFIYVMLYSGTRVGETIALKYSDFDFEANLMHIKRQCYLGEIKPPKQHSARDIPLHDVLKDEYEIHRKWHTKEMKKNGYRTDYVFTTRNGTLLGVNNLRRSLLRYYDKIGIEPKHNHAYRSTFCTQLCKCGVPLEVASKLLGHSSIEVTARHYALVQKDTKQDAIRMLRY